MKPQLLCEAGADMDRADAADAANGTGATALIKAFIQTY